MAYTLHEALRQIDPYVEFFDGRTIATVQRRLMSVDPGDQTEFVIDVDEAGRLMLLQLNLRGCPLYPPVLIECKTTLPDVITAKPEVQKSNFGFSNPGYV